MTALIRTNNNTTTLQGLSFDFNTLRLQWLQFIDVKSSTAKNYSKAVKKFAAFCQERSIAQPDRQSILDFRTWLVDDHNPCHVSTPTAQLYLTGVKLFFAFLAQEKLYSDVAYHVKGLKVSNHHRRDPLSSKEVQIILKRIDADSVLGARNLAILAIMFTCGLRTVEVSRADIGDVFRAAGKFWLRVQGKGRDAKDERVLLSPAVKRLIDNYLAFRDSCRHDEPLFASTSNRNRRGRLSTFAISRLAKAAFREAGFDSHRITAHSCRHTFVTTTLAQGVPIQDVAAAVRHANINTTLIYQHDLERLHNRAEQVAADTLLGGFDNEPRGSFVAANGNATPAQEDAKSKSVDAPRGTFSDDAAPSIDATPAADIDFRPLVVENPNAASAQEDAKGKSDGASARSIRH